MSQIPKEEYTDATAEYWNARQSWALLGKGSAFGELDRFDRSMNLWLVRSIARKHMEPADFEVCDSRRWTGDIMKFWKDVLTGQKKMPIGWDRHSEGWVPVFRDKAKVNCCGHGCSHCESVYNGHIERVRMTVSLEWPRPGFVAPLTPNEYDTITAIPEPGEHKDELDAEIMKLLQRSLKTA